MTASPPKLKTPALAVLFAVVFINLVGFGLVVPLLPFFAQSLKAEAWQITLMFSAYSLGQFFAEPFWGRLSDRIGRKPVLLITLIANALGYLMLAFVPNIWLAHRGAAVHRPWGRQYLDGPGLCRRRDAAGAKGGADGADRGGVRPGLHRRAGGWAGC